MDIKIYCDGSCSGNGKIENFGGYGVVMLVNNRVYKTFSKGKRNTTNNEMELMGLLTSVKMAKALDQEVTIYCDSAYCVNTVNNWMHGWAGNGWIKKSNNRPPENLEIIKELYDLLNFNNKIKIVKVKGHADNKYNNMADRLAAKASAEIQAAYLGSLAKRK